MTVYENIEVSKEPVDESEFRCGLELLHAALLAADWQWSWRPRVVTLEGDTGHVSDVLRISKGIDVGHRGSWERGHPAMVQLGRG